MTLCNSIYLQGIECEKESSVTRWTPFVKNMVKTHCFVVYPTRSQEQHAGGHNLSVDIMRNHTKADESLNRESLNIYRLVSRIYWWMLWKVCQCAMLKGE